MRGALVLDALLTICAKAREIEGGGGVCPLPAGYMPGSLPKEKVLLGAFYMEDLEELLRIGIGKFNRFSRSLE